MGIEIERKFLVVDNSYKDLEEGHMKIIQGYLSINPDSTIRIRISGNKAWLTVKSKNHGDQRGEWEYEIPVNEAKEMLSMCCQSGIIDKTRHIVPANDGLKWEIDEFHGNYAGLVIAEIELPSCNTEFEKPDFLGEEVTGNPKYYNSVLSKGI